MVWRKRGDAGSGRFSPGCLHTASRSAHRIRASSRSAGSSPPNASSSAATSTTCSYYITTTHRARRTLPLPMHLPRGGM
eukprot:314259-Pleurochrysis_carterae.AAC.1